MSTKGFTKIDNSVLFDLDLTPAAYMLYSKVKYFATIQGFKINREHIKSVSGYGETSFRRAWKELKDKGLLIQTKERIKGKFEYTYELAGVKPVKAKTTPKHIDSDGNIPLDGQVTVYDVIALVEENKVVEEHEPVKEDMQVTNENIEVITETTGLDAEQSKELLKVAGDDVTKVIESYKYVMNQANVKNIYSYIKWTIKNNKILSVAHGSQSNKGYFNNYPQRIYDVSKLERALLYGEEYELPV